ncbi:MAG: AMP-binding protein [Clostridia bacterium]|nr:AMP-binding protein [Clostridia bacterium]
MTLISALKGLKYRVPEEVKRIMFSGEVMPVKQLNYWRSHYPNALFSNLFGPTETTDICTFYTVNRTFSDNETLPIGKPCDNCDVFVLNADGKPVTGDEAGELYVRGSFLSAGYFGNAEKTAAAFVQNPCNPHYPEPVYKTGDLVRYNQYGELEYISRIDFQIKHMGYRIELGEIENAAYSVEAVTSAAVIYDSAEDKIVLVYTGKIKETEMYTQMTGKVPSYMQPNVIIKIRNMPYNQNGKTDRVYLKEHYRELIKKFKENYNGTTD